MIRRCHPMRLFRLIIFVTIAIIIISILWRYTVNDLTDSHSVEDRHYHDPHGHGHLHENEMEHHVMEHHKMELILKNSADDVDSRHELQHKKLIHSYKPTPTFFAKIHPHAENNEPFIARSRIDTTRYHPIMRENYKPTSLPIRELDKKAQLLLDYIGENMDVRYDVLANEVQRYHINITFRNIGTETIRPCCWSIYFYHMKFIDTYVFNAGLPMFLRSERHKMANRSIVRAEPVRNFQLDHVNGYTFRLKPTNSFIGLDPGEAVSVRMTGGGWAISRGEVLPNWYVANDISMTEPRLLRSTADEDMKFVGAFDTVEKSTRSEEDYFRPYSPEQRYVRNKIPDIGHTPKQAIVPTPLIVTKSSEASEKVKVNGHGWSIRYASSLKTAAYYLKDHLKVFTAKDLEISDDDDDETHCKPKLITLRLKEDFPITGNRSKSLVLSEGYVLTVSVENDCISITGPAAAGVFNGAVSLISLAETDSKLATPTEYAFPALKVVDAPRYEYRGVMVDVVRNFHTKMEMLKLMDALAMFKMNKLHLHLGDDEGWRLEIPGLEDLTRYGSRRGHDLQERKHLMSMLGSGPFTNSSGSGFYSVNEYQDILRHAASLHIEVIPEFDMPGHSHAAIRSMLVRYERLKREGQEKEGMRFLLSDLADQSVYMSGQFFRDGAINPCLESSYRFVEHLVVAVIGIYKSISPLRRFHFGGDEVPGDAYTASPACSKLLLRHTELSDTKSLKTYFVRRVANIIGKHGLIPHGWEDAYSLESGSPMDRTDIGSASELVSQAWYNTWESGLAMRSYQYANLGYKVVMSPTTTLYFDNPQEPDPEDWGLHWATRYIDTRRTFYFVPDNMYDSIDYNFMGRPLTKAGMCDTKRINCEPLLKPENILGLEGATWSELIRTSDRLDAMLWPRLLAMSERAWHRADWEVMALESARRSKARRRDWIRFANSLGYKELERLEKIGVNFYLPRPGVRVKDGRISVNTMFPGLAVQVSSDDGQTWSDFDPNEAFSGSLLFATRSYNGKRRSVPVTVDLV